MDLTVVTPFYEGHDTIRSLVRSIPAEVPIIIVDDISDRTLKIKDARVRVFRLEKKGYFSGAVNFGIKRCSTDVLILNQDIHFDDRRAFDLVLKNRNRYAMIGEQISGAHPAWPMGYIHGTFMFMRRDAIQSIGLLNEEHYPLWGSTCEWQLRACRKGYEVLPLKVPGMTHKRKGNYGSSIAKLLADNPGKRNLFIRTPPLISVIVPSYNHGRFLPELIGSLIGGPTALGPSNGQTFQAFDVIIADDCSTDNTQEVMKDLANPWKGIKYVRTKKNSGTSAACNLAIQSSYAKYIARIDADDMRESASLERMLKVQLENQHSFVYDDIQLFTPNGITSKAWRMKDYDFDELIEKNFIHAGIMLPKEAWTEVGGYPEEMRHGRDDWAFNIALGLKGWCGVHLQEPGYLYRRHGENRTLTNTTPVHRAEFKQKIMSLYPEAFQEVRPMACCGGGRPIQLQSQTYQSNNGRGGILSMPTMPGTRGFVLLEYLGTNSGNVTYFGPATGSAYEFSSRKNRRWVDPNDLHYEIANGKQIGLLDILDNRRKVFQLVRQPVAEKVAEATVIAKEMAPKPAPEPVESELPGEEEALSYDEVMDADYFTELSGVGKTTSQKLISKGYYSFVDVAEADMYDLAEDLGWKDDKVIKLQKEARKKISN